MLQVNGFKSKHRRKCVRKWKEIIKLVIGKDMGLEDVNNMTDKSLTRYFDEKPVLEGYKRRWIKDSLPRFMLYANFSYFYHRMDRL